MGDLVLVVEKISCLISREAIYERLYQPGTIPEDVLANLDHALVGLYSEIFRILALCHRLFVKNTTKRAVHAIFNPGDVSALLETCEKLEKQVEYEVQNCERTRSQAVDEESKELLESLQEPALRSDQNVLSLLEKIDEKERLGVLDWISKVLYGLNHQTVKEERTADTCGWLLGHNRYQEWQDSSASIILWLRGTGKLNAPSFSESLSNRSPEKRELAKLFSPRKSLIRSKMRSKSSLIKKVSPFLLQQKRSRTSRASVRVEGFCPAAIQYRQRETLYSETSPGVLQ
jgi:hypothetical protein